MYKILLALTVLCSCKRDDPHISMSLVSRDFLSDIEVYENRRIPVTEYYQIKVLNLLYDTLFIEITHFQNSEIKSVQSSAIIEYDDHDNIKLLNLPYGTKPDTTLTIPYASEKQILFYLPDLLDSVGYITYTFGVDYDSSGMKKRRNLILSSKIKDRPLILK